MIGADSEWARRVQGAGLEAEPPALAGRPKSRKREMAYEWTA